MARGQVTLRLTPKQALLINSALAYFEADDQTWNPDYSKALMDRTREVVHQALEIAGHAP